MRKDYPTLEEAEKIWQEGIEFRRKNTCSEVKDQYNEEMYIFHTKSVAKIASAIASRTVSLNPEKAYVLGLLHDYGRRIDEYEVNKFHGWDGYIALATLGYQKSAQICLSHTFPDKDFSFDKFSYPMIWLEQAKKELKKFEYDEYDRLIQLCDKLATGYGIVTIEHRVSSISKRYNLSREQFENHLNEGLRLKTFFDVLCRGDIYKVIGINEDEI